MALKKMYYPKLVYASFTIEGVFLFGIVCLSNKIYGLESLYYIGNFQIIHMEEPNKSHWETPLRTLTSHINFDPMTKTKSSGAMCGFRPQISDLEPLDIMC